MITRLLLIVTVADLELFILKNNLIIYTKAIFEVYNWNNYRQVHKIYKVIELEKMLILTIKNYRNLSAYQIIETLLIFCTTYVISKNQDRFMFYVNNYFN